MHLCIFSTMIMKFNPSFYFLHGGENIYGLTLEGRFKSKFYMSLPGINLIHTSISIYLSAYALPAEKLISLSTHSQIKLSD